MDKESTALDELKALMKVPGALRIITSEHACGGGKHPSIPPFDLKACASFEAGLGSPKHFMVHSVVRLEERTDVHGTRLVRVWSKERDWCEGTPDALLRRLREWRD